MASYRLRLKQIQAQKRLIERFKTILEAIDRGAYYDELTEEEQAAYCQYLGTDKETFETVLFLMCCTDRLPGELSTPETMRHFKIKRKHKPPTPKEHIEASKEISAMLKEIGIKE